MQPHVPVMPAEVLQYLQPRPGGVYVDCTVGAGGHSRLIAEAIAPGGRLIGFDRDPHALELAAPRLQMPGVQADLVHAGYADIREQLSRLGIDRVDGLMADLGVSSMQLDQPERGFSFSAEGPLDMRMDPTQELTAEQVVNQMSERELADLIFQFGEERRSRRIARAIVSSRPLRSTAQLAELIAAVNRPMSGGRGKPRIHPATRTFQALRIFVNSEIEQLTGWLEQVPEVLKPGGRAVVISFHSLEDRPVKENFRNLARQGVYEVLTPHVVWAGEEEVRQNPRARSARIRAVRRIG